MMMTCHSKNVYIMLKLFKFNQYIQLKNPPNGCFGYLIKGYEYINGELYLISGDSNTKHNINDIKEHYQVYIKNLIEKEKLSTTPT